VVAGGVRAAVGEVRPGCGGEAARGGERLAGDGIGAVVD
jgi:hypothetical protein